ncbi:MAG TPA: bifunctional riboflavin kinase/FAD synthetase [Oscillatoriaceae cyanobacterium]
MKVNLLHYPHLTVERELLPTVIAIGQFDGLHQGHQRVIACAQRLADALGVSASVFTFIEHPRTILRPDRPVPQLTPWPEKLARLEKIGLDSCVAAHFTPDLAALAPEAFVTRILVGQLHARGVVTGFNFHFGHKAAGNPEVLKALGDQHGFPVHVVQPIEGEGAVVSSSRIRELLATGQLAEANALLGYDYTLSGKVVHGDQRGRQIGFPTANLEVAPDKLLPAFGVYACWVRIGDRRYAGVVNIGQRPTFNPPKLMIEAHVFDFAGDLYGQTLELSLVARLRAEQAFPSIEALVEQIRADCRQARGILGVGVA